MNNDDDVDDEMDDDDDDDDKLTIDMKAEAKTDPSNLNNELKN